MPEPLVRWSIEWGNPYTNPPDGQPRVLDEEVLPRGTSPKRLEVQVVPGNGYSLCWRGLVLPADHKPKRMSLAGKQKIRRSNLARRILRAAPLFFAQFYREALMKDREYFGKG